MDKKSISEFFYCICVAMTMQITVALIVLWISPSGLADKQSELSTIYSFGGGLSKETLLQFGIVSVLTGINRLIFMSELIIKNAKPSVRLVAMFTVEIIMICLAVWLFGWFRPKNLESVLGFAVGFGACLIVSIFLGVKAEKTKNQEMNQALRRVQEKQKH
ncbi:MAG: hypothetical protein IKD90_06320 [Clostridiales bacterium]|nr:hypothetical protein [Clostridiales bacterium]